MVTNTQEWHVAPELWEGYAAGALDPAAELSVETHVMSCSQCRAMAGSYVVPDIQETVWRSVQQSVSAPKVAFPLRWLRRLGVPDHELVVLGAADAVMLPWITAVGAALACAIVSGLSGLRYEMAFLVLAPLVPVLSVVAAFDATKSLREVSAPTPYSKLRLALLRTSFALAFAVPVTMAIGLLIPNLQSLAFAWLLPGLGLTASALVLLTWLRPWIVGGVVSALWGSAAAAASGFDRTDLITGIGSQLGFVLAALALGLIFTVRTTSWRLLGGDS
ncbi:hypothetical protein [Kribbella sp. NPDC055071]